MLADACEKGVAQLVQAHLQDAGEIIGDDKDDGAEQEGGQKAGHIEAAVQRIRCPFERIGAAEKDDLGKAQEDDGPSEPLIGEDRKSGVEGTSMSVRVDLGGRCVMKNKTQK